MLSSNGFDFWADTYDQSVRQAEKSDQYPFAGYTRVMNAIYAAVMAGAPADVLDIGFGTGLLTETLYRAGCDITGIDFSAAMIEKAKRKMPQARLIPWDFTHGLPPALTGERFDFIISTYALHHLAGRAQGEFVLSLLGLLSPRGRLLIGDVCFATEEALLACRQACGDKWDGEENYFVYSSFQTLPNGFIASFSPFSHCSGVIEIARTQ